MKFIPFFLCLLLHFQPALQAQHYHSHAQDRTIEFPDVPGYQTLVCDLHMHTVFSDGSVWPDIRVEEARKDGLDAIAMTEHLEYQPHKQDIPHPDRNRSYQVAQSESARDSLIIINGSEITRDLPPGHSNAIFLEDANALLVDDSVAAFREARKQGAFTFWNHPNWTAQAEDGIARLTGLHRMLIEQDLLHGIEVANTDSYSEEALQIALDNDLTILGTSDIHGLIDWDYEVGHGGHRPVTLVFAEERSKQGIKDGLMQGRTVVWFNNLFIGKEEHMVPLLEQSISVKSASYLEDTQVLSVMIENKTGAAFILENQSDFTFQKHSDLIEIAPRAVTEIQVKTLKKLGSLTLPFSVQNAVIAPGSHPEIALEITL